jgi:1,4-alpha-glucan branching enzyme
MGQEFAASSLFAFFSDHKAELASEVWKGRRKFLRQFDRYATAEAQAKILDPSAEATFAASKLNLDERETHKPMLDLHRELLRIRREDPVISPQSRDALDGAVLAEDAFLAGTSRGLRVARRPFNGRAALRRPWRTESVPVELLAPAGRKRHVPLREAFEKER